MPNSRGNLIIIGASARAAAQSAIRAGYEPWCIDLFADRDLQAIAPVKRCPRELWPQGILELMKDAPPGPVLFTGAMENHLGVVEQILRNRVLVGGTSNGEDVARRLRRIRDPNAIGAALSRWMARSYKESPAEIPDVDKVAAHIPRCPEVHREMTWFSRMLHLIVPGRRRFLVKPRHGGGGSGIRHWKPGSRIAPTQYIQECLSGCPISAVYFMVGGVARLVGATEQLIGDTSFGAAGFLYVGNITPVQLGADAIAQLECLGDALGMYEPMEGVFGIDAILLPADDTPRREQILSGRLVERVCPIEVNPRYVASVELLERAFGRSLFTALLRLDACAMPFSDGDSRRFGKAVVRAKHRCRVPDFYSSIPPDGIADVPQVGDVVETGEPVCTVFAEAQTRDECYAGLRDMAEKVYTRLQPA